MRLEGFGSIKSLRTTVVKHYIVNEKSVRRTAKRKKSSLASATETVKLRIKTSASKIPDKLSVQRLYYPLLVLIMQTFTCFHVIFSSMQEKKGFYRSSSMMELSSPKRLLWKIDEKVSR